MYTTTRPPINQTSPSKIISAKVIIYPVIKIFFTGTWVYQAHLNYQLSAQSHHF
jgi:hypothetical protein